jgi:hypothetical protein
MDILPFRPPAGNPPPDPDRLAELRRRLLDRPDDWAVVVEVLLALLDVADRTVLDDALIDDLTDYADCLRVVMADAGLEVPS